MGKLVADHHRRRLVRFAALGCSNAVIGYGVFAFFMDVGLFPDHARGALSQTCSYGVGVVWAFFWSRHWAFREPQEIASALSRQAIRFMLVQSWSLFFSVLLVYVTIDRLGWPSLAGWPAAMSIVTVVHYLAMSSWVFPLRAGSHA